MAIGMPHQGLCQRPAALTARRHPARARQKAARAAAEPCEKCGQPGDKIPWGCDKKGRIPGGVGSLPGFQSWWPIKAYRPCPALAERGFQYERTGQITDEVLFGGRKQAVPPSRAEPAPPEPPADKGP